MIVNLESKQWDLVQEYCDNVEPLKQFIEKVGFQAELKGIKKSTFNDSLNSLHWIITINNQQFDFYGSHNDAQAFKTINWYNPENQESFKILKRFKTRYNQEKEQKEVKNDLLYSFLCCVGSEIYCPILFEDFCLEFGYDEDSRQAEKIHKKCLEFKGKLLKAGFSENWNYPQ